MLKSMRKEEKVNNKGGKIRSWWLKQQIKLIQTRWREGKREGKREGERDEQLKEQESQRFNDK